jgi:hypothetical protein
MDTNGHEHCSETYQEGVTPVQAFISPAIRVTPGMALAPRHGRPVKREVEQPGNTPPAPDSQPGQIPTDS